MNAAIIMKVYDDGSTHQGYTMPVRSARQRRPLSDGRKQGRQHNIESPAALQPPAHAVMRGQMSRQQSSIDMRGAERQRLSKRKMSRHDAVK